MTAAIDADAVGRAATIPIRIDNKPKLGLFCRHHVPKSSTLAQSA